MESRDYRAVRRELGLTQVELAERLGVRPNTIARRERGERPISREAEIAIRALTAAGSCTTRTAAGGRDAGEETSHVSGSAAVDSAVR